MSHNVGGGLGKGKEKPAVASLRAIMESETATLVVDLCKSFYHLGWVTGTGGSITVKDKESGNIWMTPSGVQKERISPSDLFLLDGTCDLIKGPENLKLTACAPLFQHAYRLRQAGAVIHSHGINCVLACLISEKRGLSEFRIQHQEMIKGVTGHGYHDELIIPIIENTARESDLADSMGAAMKAYPHSQAVLVKRHGIYIWGKDWQQAKTQSECIHYLLECAVKMDGLGVDPSAPPLSGCQGCGKGMEHERNHRKRPRLEAKENGKAAGVSVVLLDIEGTTTPIKFVKDTLFPYAKERIDAFLDAHYDEKKISELGDILEKMRIAKWLSDAPGLLPELAPESTKLERFKATAHILMKEDIKAGPLKELQGLIWAEGYASGELKGEVYDDVPDAVKNWVQQGYRVAIYSSGSRQAQRLLFANLPSGDLRQYLTCYFDTSSGPKREAHSYVEIAASLGLDSPSEICFVTDVIEEGEAAQESGCQVVLSVRPGNAPLPADHKFTTATSFKDIQV
ncbi:unnamed protein product [Chrysoparadoxa australica]